MRSRNASAASAGTSATGTATQGDTDALGHEDAERARDRGAADEHRGHADPGNAEEQEAVRGVVGAADEDAAPVRHPRDHDQRRVEHRRSHEQDHGDDAGPVRHRRPQLQGDDGEDEPEEQRTGVAHEDPRRVPVVEQERQARGRDDRPPCPRRVADPPAARSPPAQPR